MRSPHLWQAGSRWTHSALFYTDLWSCGSCPAVSLWGFIDLLISPHTFLPPQGGQRSGSTSDWSPVEWAEFQYFAGYKRSFPQGLCRLRVIKPALVLTSTRPTNWIREPFHRESEGNTWWRRASKITVNLTRTFLSSSGCTKPKKPRPPGAHGSSETKQKKTTKSPGLFFCKVQDVIYNQTVLLPLLPEICRAH